MILRVPILDPQKTGVPSSNPPDGYAQKQLETSHREEMPWVCQAMSLIHHF